MVDAFALTVALAAADAGQTGWSFDPSKRSDIYDALETATDRCADVANVIEGVVLEYA